MTYVTVFLSLGIVVFVVLWARAEINSRRSGDKATKLEKSNEVLKTARELQLERNRKLRNELKSKIREDLETTSPGDVLDDFVNARSVLPNKDKD